MCRALVNYSTRIITVMILVSIFSFKPSRKMNQVYYTQEGKPYILRVVTKILDNQVVAAPIQLEMRAVVSQPYTSVFPWTFVDVNTSKPIVPLMYNFAATDISGGPFANVQVADIASPYYKFFLNNTPNYKHINCLSKVAPCIELNAFNDDLNYNYGLKYGQTVLSTADFIETVGFLNMVFVQNQGFAITNTQDFPATTLLPASTYRFAISFIYFELQ